MPSKYVLQQRGASGLENKAEIPALENGKIDMSWLPVVGESGAAIIARGSNANGEWVRWEDGTQVCWIPTLTAQAENSVYVALVWTFPAAFLNNNVVPYAVFTTAIPGTPFFLYRAITSSTSTTFAFRSYDGNAASGSGTCCTLAIGRWK